MFKKILTAATIAAMLGAPSLAYDPQYKLAPIENQSIFVGSLCEAAEYYGEDHSDLPCSAAYDFVPRDWRMMKEVTTRVAYFDDGPEAIIKFSSGRLDYALYFDSAGQIDELIKKLESLRSEYVRVK